MNNNNPTTAKIKLNTNTLEQQEQGKKEKENVIPIWISQDTILYHTNKQEEEQDPDEGHYDGKSNSNNINKKSIIQ
mgnify:CR=1 FL=1